MSAEAALPAYLRETADGCTIAIRVQPGAKRTAIVGIYGEGGSAQLKIALQAPPVDGQANEALLGFLASTLRVPLASVIVRSGAISRSKVFFIGGMKSLTVNQILQAPRVIV